jgi:aspartyl-tRNA(Asn)/glutamyl-tRNA(Gln) amidotransferase subunit A
VIDFDALARANAGLNAFVDFDRAAAFGVGPLAGVTVGVKSNIAVKGLPFTAGMGLFRDRIAGRDAAVVARLRAAGAAILGTLNMHEAALGATTDNPFFGRTFNPHGAGLTPGGSSGGSGAAVTAGLCDLALGTDTLGSVRIPAALCGVYGLKPTAGSVCGEGLEPLDLALDCIGPLAREIGLLERAWAVIADDPGDPHIATRRLLVLPEFGGVQVQPAIAAAFDRAQQALGLPAEMLTVPAALDDVRLAAFAQVGRSLSATLGARLADPCVSPTLRFVVAAALGMAEQPALLADTRSALLEALAQDGVVLMPTAPQVAFPHTSRPPTTQPLFTGLANVTGCPALSIPAGRDADGLPVAVQLIGPPRSEPALIALAQQLEPVLGGFARPPGYLS